MIKREELTKKMFDTYWSDDFIEKDYYSPYYYKDLAKEYQARKAAIFEVFEPDALAYKLADMDAKPVTIEDRALYDWQINVNNKKMGIRFIAPKRPDCLKAEVTITVQIRALMSDHTSRVLHEISRDFSQVAGVIKAQLDKDLEKMPIDVKCSNVQGTTRVSMSADIEMIVGAEFLMKEMPCLENVKFLEYNLPKILYNEMHRIEKSIAGFNR